MSDAEKEEKLPNVFISYSHDTPAHKKWVGELASLLVKKGVQVIFDQWDLNYGDDVPKFMEKSVTEADRVLMICTETYVRKADDGKGGVGYEAMIVTGELVKNLGTAKFIPVIRQENGQTAVPKCVSTRLWINLSEDQDFEEQLKNLLCELHKQPRLPKPKLGQNPFTGESTKDAVAKPAEPRKETGTCEDVTESIYERASEAARNNDLLTWRRVLKEARQKYADGLTQWRAKYNATPPRVNADLPPMVDEAFTVASPLIAVALAGVESAQDKFNNQCGIVDELLAPAKWERSGQTVVVNVPDTLVFIYQALHGGICMETGQVSLAVQLARSRFGSAYAPEPEVLYQNGEWVGWPKSIGEGCTDGWAFLTKLPDKHPWVLRVFGSKEDYLVAVSAYYAVLNVVEAADALAGGHEDLFKGQDLRLSVPVCALKIPEQLTSRAYRLLVHNPVELKQVWESVGITGEQLAQHWPAWITSCMGWLGGVYRGFWRVGLYHKNLFEEPSIRPARKTGSKAP
jgi:hypothetical protein